MGYIGFIGIVLILTAFIGLYIYTKTHPGEDINYDASGEYKRIYKQPKVYTLDCSKCVWRNAETCKECAVNKDLPEVTYDRLVEMKRVLEGRNAVPPPPVEAKKANDGFCPTGIECKDCMWRDCC